MAKIVMPRAVLAVSAFKAAAPYVATGVAAHRRRMVGVRRLVASCVSSACCAGSREDFGPSGSA